MRIPQEIKSQFYNEFKDKPFTLDEAIKVVAPYFQYDVEKAVKSALNTFARSFIASFRDKKRVRECYAYEINGKTLYAFVNNSLDFTAKKNMLHNIQSKKAGLAKAERKIKKITILDNQISLLDVTNQ